MQKTAGESLAEAQAYAEGTAKSGQKSYASSRKAVEQRLKDARDAANEQVGFVPCPNKHQVIPNKYTVMPSWRAL